MVKILAGLLMVLLLGLSPAWSQYAIQVAATDGSGFTDTLNLAIDPAGTAGFDSLSPSLHEYEIPVHAFGLDFRVATNLPDDNLGLGAYTSIHHMSRPTQTDKWKLQFNVDSGRTSLDVTWPAGLGGVGGGMWILRANPSDPISFTDVDMTTQTAFSIPVSDNDPHSFYIVTGDKQKYRSFSSSDISSAVDSKLKPGKAEARKPTSVIFDFQLVVPAQGTDGLVLSFDFGMNVNGTATQLDNPNPGYQSKPFFGKKVVVNWSPGLDSATTITVHGVGDKGKVPKIKYHWGARKANAITTFSYLQLGLKMPNVNNVLQELYAQSVFLPPYGLYVGDPVNPSAFDIKSKPIYKAVTHPKWTDVMKTMLYKGVAQTGPADCLSNFITTKPILKVLKTLPPSKHNNVLLGDAVALKVNIGAGDGQKIEEGGTAFGDLVYVPQAGDPAGVPAGQTVRAISAKCDSVLRCLPQSWGGSYGEWDAMLARINGSFSGVFDTLSFGNASDSKPAGIKVKGTKAIADVPFLYRPTFADLLPPYTPPDFAKIAAENQPAKYSLAQNYPNPFNPTTTIEFTLPEQAFVTLKLYNILGQEMATLINHEAFDEGTSEYVLDASQFASGVYYYRLIVNDGQFQQIRKMLLIK